MKTRRELIELAHELWGAGWNFELTDKAENIKLLMSGDEDLTEDEAEIVYDEICRQQDLSEKGKHIIYRCEDAAHTAIIISIDNRNRIARVFWNSEDRWEYEHTSAEVEDDSSWCVVDYDNAVRSINNEMKVLDSTEVDW